jgi:aryl-alcohol dehydrogenase-like predicted oxidoreductase
LEFRNLGRTGLKVSSLAFGAMSLGSWANNDHDEGVRIIHAAHDAGVNLIDTADAYSRGESETIVGKAIADRRDQIILATKFTNPMGRDPNMRGGSRRWIMLAVEQSLRRLGTDWLDIYYAHRPDPDTDIEETLDALTDLVRAGKIRYIGCSTFRPHQIAEAQWTSRGRGLSRFVIEQPPYSILARGIEADLLPVCRRYDMGAMTWSPLAGGWLSGAYGQAEAPRTAAREHREKRNAPRFDRTDPANQRKAIAVEALEVLAQEFGLPLPQMAVAFAMRHPDVTSVIIGPRTLDQLTSLTPAAALDLPEALLDRIDQIVPPGVTLNMADAGWADANALADPAVRRRPARA